MKSLNRSHLHLMTEGFLALVLISFLPKILLLPKTQSLIIMADMAALLPIVGLLLILRPELIRQITRAAHPGSAGILRKRPLVTVILLSLMASLPLALIAVMATHPTSAGLNSFSPYSPYYLAIALILAGTAFTFLYRVHSDEILSLKNCLYTFDSINFIGIISLIGASGTLLNFISGRSLEIPTAFVLSGASAFFLLSLALRVARTKPVSDQTTLFTQLLTESPVEGVIAIHSAIFSYKGSREQLHLDVMIARNLPEQDKQYIEEGLSALIHTLKPGVYFSLHLSDIPLTNDTIARLFSEIAKDQGLALKSLELISEPDSDKLCLSYHLDIDPQEKLARFHEKTTHLESLMLHAFGGKIRFEPHIHIRDDRPSESLPLKPELNDQIKTLIEANLGKAHPLHRVSSVKSVATSQGIVVNCHCYAEEGATMQSVQEGLEVLSQTLKNAVADIHKVVGTAEPSFVIH